jgi:hypothetical protein
VGYGSYDGFAADAALLFHVDHFEGEDSRRYHPR